jgi:hypothetical protein
LVVSELYFDGIFTPTTFSFPIVRIAIAVTRALSTHPERPITNFFAFVASKAELNQEIIPLRIVSISSGCFRIPEVSVMIVSVKSGALAIFLPSRKIVLPPSKRKRFFQLFCVPTAFA